MAIKQANWDATKIREKLLRDTEAHADSVRCAELSKLKAEFEVCNLASLKSLFY